MMLRYISRITLVLRQIPQYKPENLPSSRSLISQCLSRGHKLKLELDVTQYCNNVNNSNLFCSYQYVQVESCGHHSTWHTLLE